MAFWHFGIFAKKSNNKSNPIFLIFRLFPTFRLSDSTALVFMLIPSILTQFWCSFARQKCTKANIFGRASHCLALSLNHSFIQLASAAKADDSSYHLSKLWQLVSKLSTAGLSCQISQQLLTPIKAVNSVYQLPKLPTGCNRNVN